jgi:hypothetical protein
MRAQFWQSAWKKDRWIARLFGQICEPSTAKRFVEKWIASLGDTRVSLSPRPVTNSAPPTQDTCGQLYLPLFEISGRPSASLKMSGDIYLLDSSRLRTTYSEWAMRLKRACLARRKSAPRTTASGCSYWPTILANSGNGVSGRELALGDPKKRLGVAVQFWRTPMASDGMGGTEEFALGQNKRLNLRSQAATLSLSGRRCRTTTRDGAKFPHTLNPLFCEWLMGWPTGWTGSALAATELSRWSRLMLGELSRLECNLNGTSNESS